MAQNGYIFKQGGSWFVRYRDNFTIDGQIVRKQVCKKLAEVCDRYRRERDVQPLVDGVMAKVRQSEKCTDHAGWMFVDYVNNVYLPFVARAKKSSTYAGYRAYWKRYLEPRVQKYALRDFTISEVALLLKDVAASGEMNTESIKKVRSILSAIFSYAISEGHFPARSEEDNPASCARIPVEIAKTPEATEAATLSDVRAFLAALKGNPLARAAVALMAYTGVRPGECRGLRWEEWDRANRHITVNRSVWHTEVGTTKTEQSVRHVAVHEDLRGILLALWNAQGCPISGYILASVNARKKSGTKDHPVILDNLAKRVIRPTLEKAGLVWKGFYSLRRFHGTEIRMNSDSTETSAKALGNSKAVADKHYIKPTGVLPDVRRAVNNGFSGLIQ